METVTSVVNHEPICICVTLFCSRQSERYHFTN